MDSRYKLIVTILCMFSLISIGLLLLSFLLYNGNLSDTVYRDCDVTCKLIDKTCNHGNNTYDCSVLEVFINTIWNNKIYSNNCYNFSNVLVCPNYTIKCQFPKDNPSKLGRCLRVDCTDENKYNSILPLFFGGLLTILISILWYAFIINTCKNNGYNLPCPRILCRPKYRNIKITEEIYNDNDDIQINFKTNYECYCE